MRFFAVLMAVACAAVAQPLSKGFEHFYNLEFDDAIREFRAQVTREPDNPDNHNALAQGVLYREMLLGGALESELVSGSNPFIGRDALQSSTEATKLFDDSLAKAVALADARLARNANDVDALYSKGVSLGLRANYNFLVKKSWMTALRETTDARKLHNRVVELKPDFHDARLLQGVHDYVVGSLPWHMKMLGFIAGFHGNREDGIKTLRLVGQQGKRSQYDAQVLLAALYRRERRPTDALPLLKPLTERFPRNYLFRLEAVQMHSDAGDKDSALATLDVVEKMKRAGSPGFATLRLGKVHYYRGNLLFWYRDFDAAIKELQRAGGDAQSLDLHTAAMSWLRLGQCLDMKGLRNEARAAYQKAAAVAPQSDIGKESRQYMNSPYRRKA